MKTAKEGILLVYPPITKIERYSSALGASGGEQIPLGVFYLAAYARQHGIAVDAIDAEACELTNDDIIARLLESGFANLGISSTTVAFHRAIELAKAVKAVAPTTTIILGGPHVTSQPAAPMEHDVFDFGVQNEGEETLVELLECLCSGGETLDDICGLVHRKDGRVVVNPPRSYMKDIDRIPFPAYDLIPDMNRYSPPPCNYKMAPVANVITTRGCPYQCTFCDNNTFGRKWRMRSAENVVDEIELLMRDYGIREIAFVDDIFTINTQRLHGIFDLARARGLRFPWTCMSRINTVDEEILRYLRDNGCWHISFGIESGNADVLRDIKKEVDLDQIEKIVDVCHNLGILTKGFFIVGHPTDTVATIDETIAFATKLKLDDVVVTINTPMPGTHQFDHVREYGTLTDSDSSVFNYHNPVFVPFGLSREILLTKHREFYRKFYLRPRILWRYGKSFLRPTGPKRLFKLMSASRFLVEDYRKHRSRTALEPMSRVGPLEQLTS